MTGIFGLDLAKQAVTRKPELLVRYTTGQTVTDGMKVLFVENSALLPKPYSPSNPGPGDDLH
jgi:hypothetical protein